MPDPTPTNDHLPTSIFDHNDEAVEDIFSESTPVTPTPPQQAAPQVGVAINQAAPVIQHELPAFPVASGGSPVKKIALWGGLGVGLIGITAFVAFMLIKTIGGTPAVSNTPIAPTPTPAATTPSPEPTPVTPATPPPTAPQPTPQSPTTPPVLTPPPPDADSDGLSDAEEKQLGTNQNVADTDNDGLTDREEVQIYHTNPLNADTDGDGFLDGEEVKKGYNPNGPGKLIPPTVPSGASLNP